MQSVSPLLNHVRTVFSIDLRALAIFRIGLGLLILANLAILATDMRFFFTDDGIMPRRVWAMATDSLHWSVHAASGALWFQVIWFAVSAVAAVLLVIGYRSRLMSVVCWALLVSLINRNHFILQAGDQLLVILAFWSMFLPLHARYSVDAALNAKYAADPNAHSNSQHGADNNRYFSVATVALVLQVLYLYFFTALLKTGAPWRETFDAAFYAVSLEHFATPIGVALREFSGFLKFGTAYVLLVEFIAPLLVLCPWYFLPVRLFAVACLYSLHIGFLLMLHIGLFPLIDFVALVILLPGPVWDFLAKISFRPDRQPLKLQVNKDCAICLKGRLILREFFLPANTQIEHSAKPSMVQNYKQQKLTGANAVVHIISCNRWFKPLAWLLRLPPVLILLEKLYAFLQKRRTLKNPETVVASLSGRLLPWRTIKLRPHLLTQLLAGFFLYAVTYTNIAALKTIKVRAPEHVRNSIKSVRLDQRWGMFAPKPLVYSVHPVIVGTLRNGQQVDAFNNTEAKPNWHPPAYGYTAYPGYRTRKLYERVDGKVPRVSASYGDYLCRRWNHPQRQSEKQLGLIDIYSVRRRTNTTGAPKAETQHRLWQHWCYPEFEPKT